MMPKKVDKIFKPEPIIPLVSNKVIRNCSMQGISLIIKTENSSKSVWLAPKKSITISESQMTQQILNLLKRRLISISK